MRWAPFTRQAGAGAFPASPCFASVIAKVCRSGLKSDAKKVCAMSVAMPAIPCKFTLLPFIDSLQLPERDLAGIGISGSVAVLRGKNSEFPPSAQLQLEYRLAWPADDSAAAVLLPESKTAPQRRDQLWAHTCLELFIAIPGEKRYWEVNMAPSGDWAVYRLDDYRQGLQPEPQLAALPFQVHRQLGLLELRLHWNLPAELAAAAELELGASAVIEHLDGEISYWALNHPAPKADFHNRQSFALRV